MTSKPTAGLGRIGITKAQADRCVTHHHGCDCREYQHAQFIDQLTARNAELESENKRLERYDLLLSKEMPKDFKDWHENSKEDWPEVAAAVLGNRAKAIDSYRQLIDELEAQVERVRGLADEYRKLNALTDSADVADELDAALSTPRREV